MKSLLTDQKGNVIVLFALLLPILLGMAGLVVDVGYAYAEKSKLQNIADATVLAGVRELPESPEDATTVGTEYATTNGLKTAEIVTLEVSADKTELLAVVKRTAPSFFIKIFNINGYDVSARAKAKVLPLKGYTGIIPLGVEAKNFETGHIYTLKMGAPAEEQYSGNYGGLSLTNDQDRAGGNVYKDNIINGYQGPINVGDPFYTKTGNMVGPTDQGIDYRIRHDQRLVVLPIVDSIDVLGSKPSTIVGFAAFYLESAKSGEVLGKFMNIVLPGELANTSNYHAYGAVLVE